MVGLRLRRRCVVALRLGGGVWGMVVLFYLVFVLLVVCLFCLSVSGLLLVDCLAARAGLWWVVWWWFILSVLMDIALGGFGCICVWCCRLCYFGFGGLWFDRLLIVLCLVASFALHTFVLVLALIVYVVTVVGWFGFMVDYMCCLWLIVRRCAVGWF